MLALLLAFAKFVFCFFKRMKSDVRYLNLLLRCMFEIKNLLRFTKHFSEKPKLKMRFSKVKKHEFRNRTHKNMVILAISNDDTTLLPMSKKSCDKQK